MTESPGYTPYTPLNQLKPLAENIWLVDGPEIMFGFAGVELAHPTRMTIVRLPDGGLWVHSPVEPDQTLLPSLDALGPVRFLVAPNSFHHSWLADWAKLYPDAQCWGPPGLPQSTQKRLTRLHVLEQTPPPGWRGVLNQILLEGNFFKEIAFFHEASRTLILTDLIENFEASRIKSHWRRRLLVWSGIADQDGAPPLDMRLAFLGRRKVLQHAIRQMIDWRPERVILAHGRWIETNGAAELEHLFRWVLATPGG